MGWKLRLRKASILLRRSEPPHPNPKPYRTPRDPAIPRHPERRTADGPRPHAKARPQRAPSLPGHWTSPARQRVWAQSGDGNHTVG